jgi:hypothetical protein
MAIQIYLIRQGANYEHKKNGNKQHSTLSNRHCGNSSGFFVIGWWAMDERYDARKRISKHGPFELGTDNYKSGIGFYSWFSSGPEKMVIELNLKWWSPFRII